jgi:predicted dehydrogenase
VWTRFVWSFERLEKVTNSKIVAVADLNEVMAKNTAGIWNVPSCCTWMTELLFKALDVCTLPQVHAASAVEVMKAGVAVLT